MDRLFTAFATRIASIVGQPAMFAVAVMSVIVWAACGPVFGFSDTWQLVINTGTTIVTFLMVFLIQSTQNRDSKAIHLKLDELIRALHGARNNLVDLESLSEEELDHLAEEFSRFRERAHKAHASREQIERTQERIEECADAEIGGSVPEDCAR